MLRKLNAFVCSIGQRAANVLRTIGTMLFGSWHWRAPVWALVLRDAGQHTAGYMRLRRRAVLIFSALVLTLGASGYGAYRWWQAQPKPIKIDVRGLPIERTTFDENGKPRTWPLKIEFGRSVASLATADKKIVEQLRISPELAGQWQWVGDRVLEFVPTDDWPIGAKYKVQMARDAFAAHVELARYDVEFTTPSFEAKVSAARFYQDPTNPALKKAVIDLAFTHPVNAAELEQRIALALEGQSKGIWGLGREATKFSVLYDKNKLAAYVHSETLPLPKEPSSLQFKLSKGLTAARGGAAFDGELSSQVKIPGLFSLTLGDAEASFVTNDRDEPEQVLILQTSMAVSERDMNKAVSVWLLPQHHPDDKDKNPRNFHGWSADDVTDAVLKNSRKLTPEQIASEREFVETHSFKYRADVGRSLLVRVSKGLASFGGYQLGERVTQIVQMPPFPSELRIAGRGSILALSGEKKVAVLVRDLPGVRYEIGRVLPSQLQMLVSKGNGALPQPNFSGVSADDLTERFEKKVPLELARGKPHYESIDLASYLSAKGSERRGIFLLTVQGYDPGAENNTADSSQASDVESSEEGMEGEGEGDHAQPMMDNTPAEQRTDQRLIVVTDLGILLKRAADGTQAVFVQSIAGGTPVADATVEVLGRNGLPVLTASTDATGVARLESLQGLAREKAPVVLVVRKAGDMSFLPLNRSDRSLDYSRFDIGGVTNARLADQLNAYLFSDRGLYRPGDTMNIGIVTKSADWKRTLAGVPLEIEVVDARGLTVRREPLRLGAGGFSEFSHTTSETAPTGSYTVNLLLMRNAGQSNERSERIGSTVVRVQEFLPDRMKVSARLSAQQLDGWVSPKELKGLVNVQNLFGTPAENRRVSALLSLTPAFPAFRAFPDYRFYDPQRARDSYSEELQETTTNAQGDAELNLRLEKYARATYRLNLLARAFEAEGGRSVSADTAMLVSDQAFLIGYKPDGDLSYVSRNAKRSVALVAVGPNGKATAVDQLKLQWVERKYISVLAKQPNGTYRYESKLKETVLKETPFALSASGSNVALDAANPGNFAYVMRDAANIELNRFDYTVTGAGNLTRSLERNAELQLTLNKKDYAPGEEIEISVRAPYKGAGLITIERERVFAHAWFKADTTASVQRIHLPKDFEGNGYVSVQFVRDIGSDEIYMSPLSYGVAPFATNLAARSNKLELSAPELVKPGQQLKMKLSAEQPTRAVVFAVDEGILQVARYKSPDPLAHFFQKRMLEVRTTQILDLLLPEFKRLMQAAAPGGDAEGPNAQQLNPFKRRRDKPVTYWSGIVDVKGEREFTYQVPDYFNGSIRLFAVAIGDNAVGVTAGKTLARADYVLSPNAPVAVAPGDEFEVSVGVSNQAAGSGANAAIDLKLETSAHLAVVGEAAQRLSIAEGREGVAVYRLRAKTGNDAQLGSASLSFTASGSNRSARLATDVSVRPASPRYTTVISGNFNERTDVSPQRKLFPELSANEAAVSSLPLALAPGLSAYLTRFEHECSEQLLSRTLPAVVLARRPEFAPLNKGPKSAEPARVLADTLRRLRTRSNAEGGVGTWQATVEADAFASVYALHVMLEARERNLDVPADMLSKTTAYVTQLAASPARDLYGARVRAYAIYLLTRQAVVTTPLIATLREMLQAPANTWSKGWQNDLTAALLAASYQQLKQDQLAAELIAPAITRLRGAPENFAYSPYYDPLIRDALTLYLVARHFPQRAQQLPAAALVALTKPIENGAYNTLSAAYTVLALDAYADTVPPQAAAQLGIAVVGADGKRADLPANGTLIARAALAANVEKVALRAAGAGFYSVVESGFDRVPPSTELKQGMEVVREFVDAQGNAVTSVRVGDEVTVRLRVRALQREFIPSVALVDVLPGGFDPVLNASGAEPNNNVAVSRLGGRGSWNLEYADVREERVLLYGTVTGSVTEFNYRVRATNVGTFVIPPAYAESLYERTLRARSAGGATITVVKK